MPRALQTAIWFRRAQWLLSQCHRRYGDTFKLDILHEGTWIFLTDPEEVRRVFTGDPNLLHAGEANRILLPVLGDRSVLLLDGPEHLRERKLMLPAFHGKRMQRYVALMAEIAGREIDSWPRGEPYRVRPRMQAVTLEIILRAVFGVTDAKRVEPLRAALREVLDMISEPRRMLPLIALGPERARRFPPFRRLLERVDGLVYAEIAARRDEPGGDDILSLLLEARHDDGEAMTDRQLRDELVTLLVAGHETTATALAWAVERLAHNPDKLERLTAEVRDGGDEYLEAVVYETLRLRPVLSLVNRTLKVPMEFGGYELPAGVKVAPCIFLMHRRPDIYPEPERFLPERFLEQPPGTYTWIPFGGGVRRCLGGAFAQLEMEVVLRELVARAAIRSARSEPEPVYRRAITETPRYDAEVIVS